MASDDDVFGDDEVDKTPVVNTVLDQPEYELPDDHAAVSPTSAGEMYKQSRELP